MSLPNVQAELTEALFSSDSKTDLFVPGERLVIYRNNMIASLIETLQNAYPLIHTLLGDDFFRMTAKEYIRQYPSRSGNLHDYGAYFGDFLAGYQPVHDLIYLTEVAEFEWACHALYLAPACAPFEPKTLEQYTLEQHEQLRFLLNPAAKLLKFHFPILRIIDLCLTSPEEPIELHQGGVNLLIIRKELDISLNQLSEADYLFLNALACGQTLQAAHEAIPSYQLEEKLPAFIQNKILVDCYLAEED